MKAWLRKRGPLRLKLGFHELIPPNWISVFTPNELELLISGMLSSSSLFMTMAGLPTIDIEDWKEHTVYTGGYDALSQQVKWFWEWVENLSNTDRGIYRFEKGRRDQRTKKS